MGWAKSIRFKRFTQRANFFFPKPYMETWSCRRRMRRRKNGGKREGRCYSAVSVYVEKREKGKKKENQNQTTIKLESDD